MMEDRVGAANPIQELSFALAEGGAEAVTDQVRARVVRTALAERSAGRPLGAPEKISGLEAFRRSASQMDALLADLSDGEWQRPALRDLSVQELVGHLIAVEEAFFEGLSGAPHPPTGAEHVSSTQAAAKAQGRRLARATHAEWRDRMARTLAACAERPVDLEASYYGVILPLDQLLVVRAFEIWAHHEDVRRATGRPLQAPDDAVLACMVQLAAALLPVGVARANGPREQAAVRIVLTGKAGGTWDIPLGPPAAGRAGHPPSGTIVVIDAAAFCRVVANREDLAGSGAAVLGEVGPAEKLFAGAASLALD